MPPQLVSQDRTGHREPLTGALYNTTFGVVVSVDEGGTCCVWNMLVRGRGEGAGRGRGKREGRDGGQGGDRGKGEEGR